MRAATYSIGCARQQQSLDFMRAVEPRLMRNEAWDYVKIIFLDRVQYFLHDNMDDRAISQRLSREVQCGQTGRKKKCQKE